MIILHSELIFYCILLARYDRNKYILVILHLIMYIYKYRIVCLCSWSVRKGEEWGGKNKDLGRKGTLEVKGVEPEFVELGDDYVHILLDSGDCT